MSPSASGEPLWHQHFRDAAALGLRVAVLDPAASMLACANLADHLICPESALLGEKWHEFIEPGDLPAIRTALARPASAPVVLHYRQLCRINTRSTVCLITLLNVWVASAWLSYGTLRPLHAPRRLPSLSDQS